MASRRPVVVCDTREQTPWSFRSGRVEVVRGTLASADYSLAGWEGQVGIERKSMRDLINTLGPDNRDRFKRELGRLAGYRYAEIMVEGCMHDVLAGQWHGGMRPDHVLALLVALKVEYPAVRVTMAGDRATSERLAEATLLRLAHVLGAEGKAP
jgi:ERCC4-type nuclease